MSYDVDRVSNQQSPVINLRLGMYAEPSAKTVSLSKAPLGITVKMSSDISMKNVPLNMVAKTNTFFAKPDITSITD